MGEKILFGRHMIWCPPGFFRGARWNIAHYHPLFSPWRFSDYAVNDVSRLANGSCWDGQNEYYKYFKTGQPYPNHVKPMVDMSEWEDQGMNRDAMPQTPSISNVSLDDLHEAHPLYLDWLIDNCIKYGVTPDLMIPSAPDNPDHSEAQPDYVGDLFPKTWYTAWHSDKAYFDFADKCESKGLDFVVSPISSGHPKRILQHFVLYNHYKRIDGRPVFINYENIYPNTLAFRQEIEDYIGEEIFIIGKGESVDLYLANLLLETLLGQPEPVINIYRRLSDTGVSWSPFIIVPSLCRVMGIWGKQVQPFSEAVFRDQWRVAKQYPQNLNPEWGIDCLAFLYENNWWENTVWVPTVQNGEKVLNICKTEMLQMCI